MIIVKDISFIEVPGDMHEVFECKIHDWVQIFENGKPSATTAEEIQSYFIKGIRFTRPDGTEIIVGYSKIAERILGLSYGGFKNTKEELEKARWVGNKLLKEKQELEKKLASFENMTFWQRVKWLWREDERKESIRTR